MSKLSEMKRAAPQREAREERTPGKVSVAFSSVKSKLSFLRWLDPFRYVDLFVMPRVKKVTKSETVELVVNVLFAFLFAFILFAVLFTVLLISEISIMVKQVKTGAKS